MNVSGIRLVVEDRPVWAHGMRSEEQRMQRSTDACNRPPRHASANVEFHRAMTCGERRTNGEETVRLQRRRLLRR
jgi:hypothetical protein